MKISLYKKTTPIALPSPSVDAGKDLLAKASQYIGRICHWLQKQQEAAVNDCKDILAKASRHLGRIWHWLQERYETRASGGARRSENTASLRQNMKPSRNKKTTRTAVPSVPVNVGKDLLANAFRHLGRIWQWLQERQKARAGERSLRLEETVSLGQKRFVAVVKVDGQRFLIGVGTSEISMLAPLQPETSFAQALQESTAKGKSPNAIPAKLTTAIGATRCA
jgi:flagellar biosynthesis chaperone FliJ